MENLIEIFETAERRSNELDELAEEYLRNLRIFLWGRETIEAEEAAENAEVPNATNAGNVTPKQVKKRPKRLTALDETDEDTPTAKPTSSRGSSPKPAKHNMVEKVVMATKSANDLMPPPSLPLAVAVNASVSDLSHSRPQRAAKINCEKHLKEPTLKTKMRRPDESEIRIKLEHEQRASQMHESSNIDGKSRNSKQSTASQDSIVVLPTKPASIVVVPSDDESTSENSNTATQRNSNEHGIRQLRVRVKREKLSGEGQQPSKEPVVDKAKKPNGIASESEISDNTTLAEQTNIGNNNKTTHKKKVVPKPIKVERLSEIATDKQIPSPIATRTRKGNVGVEKSKETTEKEQIQKEQLDTSVYEEAVENLTPTANAQTELPKATNTTTILTAAINETVTISQHNGPSPLTDATFTTASAATFVIEQTTSSNVPQPQGDTTFDVAPRVTPNSQRSSTSSMATARDTLMPQHDSLITEDESIEYPKKTTALPPPPLPKAKKLPLSTKANKMPTRTIEIFNPLIQSPVKKKVQAFENVAAAQATANGTIKRTHSKLAKENSAPMLNGNAITPLAGKSNLPPSLVPGRFLTPTQSSNITPNRVGQTKKTTSSASKALPLAKSSSAGNIKAASSSAKAISRENSAEEFRKGLQQMAEERKKQREQKHQLAAQQREAKERERAERMAKVAKEREEKRLKKQQEAEQKKRELEEIQRNLRAQEEAAAESAKQKAAQAKAQIEQEKAMLQQIKQPQQQHSGASSSSKGRMCPPPPKMQMKYSFEMLHEDDSTDDEDKTSYKRPPPPAWSRRNVRGAGIRMQQHMPTDIVDSFFSVEPMTPDLRVIFPNIDSRHLKRNSSMYWSTPPRYSELPKY